MRGLGVQKRGNHTKVEAVPDLWSCSWPGTTMAKLEELDQQQQQPNDIKKRKKKIQGSTKLFVFVDYLFLFVFFGFLIVILFKMVGV